MTTKTTFKLNLGPQHPSTHGVLRLLIELDGEKIISCEPDVGYLHRGMEKMAEKMSYIQYLPTVDRIDYLAGFFYSYLFVHNIEKALNVNIPEKVRIIRVMLLELNRIASHLLWTGAFLMDLGAVSPFFYAMREREMILRFFENLTGQRMMYNYFVFGGIRSDINNFDEVEEIIRILPQKFDDYEKIITDNPVFLSRTRGKGILKKEIAKNYSITGVNLRSSGVDYDLRQNDELYKGFNFETIIMQGADVWTRYKARIAEMRESLKIVEQAVDKLKSFGQISQILINPFTLKLPEGEYYAEIEAPRGLASCYIMSDGGEKPYRLKWRTGSYYSVNLLRELLVGNYLNDAIAISGSLDIVLPEVDK